MDERLQVVAWKSPFLVCLNTLVKPNNQKITTHTNFKVRNVVIIAYNLVFVKSKFDKICEFHLNRTLK